MSDKLILKPTGMNLAGLLGVKRTLIFLFYVQYKSKLRIPSPTYSAMGITGATI